MYFEFREPTTHSELRDILSVHEAVYRAAAGLSALVDGNSHHETPTVRHFGLFRCEGNENRPAGYVRVVESCNRESPELPLLQYFSTPARIQRMLSSVVRKHGMVIEGGRLSLVPELQGVRAGKHIVESLVAIYGVALNVPCLLVCFSHHQALYETLGFRRIFHHDIIRAPSGQQRGVCMYGVRIKSARVFLRAVAMAQAYRQFGAIAYHRQRPDNFAPAVIRPELIDRAARIVSRIAA